MMRIFHHNQDLVIGLPPYLRQTSCSENKFRNKCLQKINLVTFGGTKNQYAHCGLVCKYILLHYTLRSILIWTIWIISLSSGWMLQQNCPFVKITEVSLFTGKELFHSILWKETLQKPRQDSKEKFQLTHQYASLNTKLSIDLICTVQNILPTGFMTEDAMVVVCVCMGS